MNVSPVCHRSELLCLALMFVGIMVWVLPTVAHADDPKVLMESRFKDDAQGWQPAGEAKLSDVARVPGAHSIVISQWADEEQGSQWLSPAIANPSEPVTISFWAADNYLRCGDFSYSGTMDVVQYDKDGKVIASSDFLSQVVWDESRRSEMWGKLLPEGLIWKFYQVTYTPKGDHFKIKFHWPKPLLRGDCYFTDVRVATGASSASAAAKTNATNAVKNSVDGNALKLEMTTPVNGNLFLLNQPMRFEVLVYGDQPEEVNKLTQASLHWQVSDFNHRVLATGEAPMSGAAPLADPKFITSNPGRMRKHHLHKTIFIELAEAHITGQLLFLEAKIVHETVELAKQITAFGIVNPRAISSEDQSNSHFSSQWFYDRFTSDDQTFEDQSISEKSGVRWNQVYDYSWKNFQPKYPGPIKFTSQLPAFPRITYCPNIEQLRTKPTILGNYVPADCLITDPLYPERTTFDIDAYVEYIVAYIRHNRQAIARVVPGGLERTIDARTLELHRKTYAAIKKEWPELPVGFMLYGLSMNPSSDVDLFLNEKLYEVCDFIDTHCYGSSVDWTEWKRLQRTLKTLKQKPQPLYSTEFARVGGTGQVDRVRSMVAAHLDAWANGMEHLFYFNQANENYYMDRPFGRDATEVPGEQTGGFIYYQQMSWPKVSPILNAKVPSQRWMQGNWSNVYGGSSLIPVLATMSYYNLVQNYEGAAFRKMSNPTPDSVVYVFDRSDATVASLWMVAPGARKTCRIKTSLPVLVQDLFGHEQMLTPLNGEVLLTINEWPQTLLVSKAGASIAFEMIEPVLPLVSATQGVTSRVKLHLPEEIDGRKLTIRSMVAQGWLDSEQSLDASGEIQLKVPMDAMMRGHAMRALLEIDGKCVGLLATTLNVEPLLQMKVMGQPMTADQDPAILIRITSHRDQHSSGVVRFKDEWFAQSMVPVVHEQAYDLAAGKSVVVRVKLSRAMVNMTAAYPVTVDLEDASGLVVSQTDEVHFRASVRTDKPLVIDADLSDWQLEKLVGVPFERDFSNWGKPRLNRDDCDAVMYSRWDDEYLYFAVVVRDQSSVIRTNTVDIWMDDNLMFGLHPWGWSIGQPLRSGFYREHLGLCADGKARIFRVGNPQGGPTTAEGCSLAVRYADGVYTYEWSYPRSAIYPMSLEAGSAFRASVFALDRDGDEPPAGTRWAMGGVQLGGFNASINAQPDRWRQFELIDAPADKK